VLTTATPDGCGSRGGRSVPRRSVPSHARKAAPAASVAAYGQVRARLFAATCGPAEGAAPDAPGDEGVSLTGGAWLLASARTPRGRLRLPFTRAGGGGKRLVVRWSSPRASTGSCGRSWTARNARAASPSANRPLGSRFTHRVNHSSNHEGKGVLHPSARARSDDGASGSTRISRISSLEGEGSLDAASQ
jgi:hypothetical protein